VSTIVAAEQAGLDEVWLGDEGPARDPFALLAAAAGVTSTIRLGVAVTNPYLRHPATTAATALTIHELSNGRMVLGMGAGGDLALGPAQVKRARPLEATRRAVRIVRAVSNAEETEGYTPVGHAIDVTGLPIYIGARGERFNRFASEAADGVFLGGIPLSRLAATLSWARSVRPVRASIYMNAVFDEDALEAIRPQMIWVLIDTPEQTRKELGVTLEDLLLAARALGDGDDSLARRTVNDVVLDELVLHGAPETVGRELADRLGPLGPDSIGISLLSDDLLGSVGPASEALHIARARAG
jgi:5,10-methylenetetrahydromethanopterin reductase